MKLMLCLALLFSALPIVAVAQSNADASNAGSSGSRPSSVVASTYVLKPLDIIRVEVYQEDDLRREVRIEADGTVMLPLIGRITLGGLRVGDAQALLTELYDRDFIVNPQLSVIVLSYSEQRVQVLGQVNSPGFVIIPPEEGMTISQAISGARGFTRLANASRVQVRRQKEDGATEVIEIDVDDILRKSSANDFQLKDKDIVWVPERIF